MNFITRNLGWILLFLFFVFMLFIISSNKPEKQDITAFMSGAKLTQSGSELGELDKLMKKIDDENEEETHEDHKHSHDEESHNEESQDTKNSEDVVLFVGEKHEKKRGLWNRLFRKKSPQKIDDAEKTESASGELTVKMVDTQSLISNEGEIKTKEVKRGLFSRLFSKRVKDSKTSEEIKEESKNDKDVISDSNKKEEKEEVTKSEKLAKQEKDTSNLVIKKEVSQSSEQKTTTDLNLVKNTSSKSISQKTSSLPANFVFPGKNLTTKVGKNYKVGVKSLKLNNKYFTQKLGYMMKGDSLTQLAPANARGCFLAEIKDSKISSNIGKKGYVCKKWLTGDSESKSVVKEDKTPALQHGLKTDASLLEGYDSNEIGTETNVSQTYITQDDVVLEAQNTLEQASLKDADGCMKFIITKSNIINIPGKVITICQ